MRVLLDTNAYSAFKLGDPDIVDTLTHADEILIPTTNSPGDRARLRINASKSTIVTRIPRMRKLRELQDGAIYHVTARRT